MQTGAQETGAQAPQTSQPVGNETQEVSKMPEGVLQEIGTATEQGTQKAGDVGGDTEVEGMPKGVLTEGTGKWQQAAGGSPEKYEGFKVFERMGDDGQPKYNENYLPKEGENAEFDYFVKEAKELGLTQEQAQQHLDRGLAFADMLYQKDHKEHVERALEWKRESDNMSLINPESVRLTQSVLGRFDPNGRIKQLLEETGASSLPEIIHMMTTLGRHISAPSVSAPIGNSPNVSPNISKPESEKTGADREIELLRTLSEDPIMTNGVAAS